MTLLTLLTVLKHAWITTTPLVAAQSLGTFKAGSPCLISRLVLEPFVFVLFCNNQWLISWWSPWSKSTLIKSELLHVLCLKSLLIYIFESSDYIGALPGLCQGIGKTDYPQIIESMVSMPDVKPGDAVSWLYTIIRARWLILVTRYSGIAIKYTQSSKRMTLRLTRLFCTFLLYPFVASTQSISKFKETHLRRACKCRQCFCICSRFLITKISLISTELLPISLVTTLKRHLKIELNQALSAMLPSWTWAWSHTLDSLLMLQKASRRHWLLITRSLALLEENSSVFKL